MNELTAISNATMEALAKRVKVPTYDRVGLTPGIVHIGLGNFHRAHQAWYLHRLMEMGLAHDWAIIGAGVRPADALQREKLLAQDCLTTLIELDPAGRSAEICGAMIGFVPVEPENASLIAQMADPRIRIVSLTVTEGGYFIDPVSGGFHASHPDIIYDAANPAAPRTAFGAVIAALRVRRDKGLGAFTCLSCDNLQGNGTVLRQSICALAELSDPGLAKWIAENACFPNSMVDCIVPATGVDEVKLAKGFGIEDASPVTHENFRQWVIEDDFCAGRPPWEEAGATISNDVHAFERMKIRILNGGHQVIAGPGELLGHETIARTMADPLITDLLSKVVTEEIAPHVAAVPGHDPASYLALVKERFSNPEIKDTTRRVAFDGSSRHPGFVIPTIRDGLAAGTSVDGLALVSAIWARYCTGFREDGSEIEPNDPHWSSLVEVARKTKNTPSLWLEQRQFYGDLADDTNFAPRFAEWVALVHAQGVAAAIRTYLG